MHFSSVLLIHNLLQKHENNIKVKMFRESRASLFQSACDSCNMITRQNSYLNKTIGNVALSYLLYEIEDTSLLLVLKVIFKSRVAKNALIISEFVRFSIFILLRDSACSLYNFIKDST